MGSKITTIVTTVVILLLMLTLISFLSMDFARDDAIQRIKTFSQDVQYKGYITASQYKELADSIPYKSFKIQVYQFKRDDMNYYDIDTQDIVFINQMMIGNPAVPDVDEKKAGFRMYAASSEFNDYSGSILNSGTPLLSGLLYQRPENKNIYKFKMGDRVKVDLYVMENSTFELISAFVTGKSAPKIKLLTSESGAILNEKWRDNWLEEGGY
jgi:hypothetical protein